MEGGKGVGEVLGEANKSPIGRGGRERCHKMSLKYILVGKIVKTIVRIYWQILVKQISDEES